MTLSKKDIDNQRNQLLQQKKLSDALNRLYSNPDFVFVFKNYYSKEMVLDLVSKLSLYDNESAEYKETIKSLNVISSFNQFLNELTTQGAMVDNELSELATIPEEEIDYE